VKTEHVRPGERNPIEGKFGQAKNKYGLEKIRARLTDTSESWIASIILVLNLVKLTGQVPLALIFRIIQKTVTLIKPEGLYFFSRPYLICQLAIHQGGFEYGTCRPASADGISFIG